ncbi:co-chaperone GroES [Candidatus Mesenet endosymbiont of Phosphuga atrata]|uniref:co-chaperone GroES n=1 Tax=Candidatus Mesenet endosymbiont of Phosphuga atrata TaxID=3066221 RepID=UPI0030D3C293
MLKMLDDNVLIQPLDEEEKSSGIMLPDSAKKKPTKGEIKAVGPGGRNAQGERMALTVKVGDKVFYRQWAGTEVECRNDKLVVMKESDILAIVEGK